MKGVKSFIQIITILTEQDFLPKRVDEIATDAGVSRTTAWRLLKSLEENQWAVYNPAEHTWKLGKALTDIAFAYKRHMQGKMLELNHEYEMVAGETLSHD